MCLHVCSICGTEIKSKPGRGRPRVHCSDACRDVSKYWAAFQKALDSVELSPAAATEQKGGLGP
jgi:endogenous inhibitor of DNA gyrase (YacG/DUF329 family)